MDPIKFTPVLNFCYSSGYIACDKSCCEELNETELKLIHNNIPLRLNCIKIKRCVHIVLSHKFIWLFADDCIIYRKIMDSSDIDKLQTDLKRLGEWAVEDEIKINPDKGKEVSFTKARVNERIRYYFGKQLILEASSFKYLRIITVEPRFIVFQGVGENKR